MSDRAEPLGLEQLIAAAWEKARAGAASPTVAIGLREIVATADDENGKGLPPTIDNWLRVYDEFGSWFASLAMLLTTQMIAAQTPQSTRRRSVLVLLGNITSQIIAIRRLVCAGLDVQAKQLARILTEQIDVAILVSLDNDSADAFMSTNDVISANRFWHENIKGRKFRRKLYSAMESTLGTGHACELIAYIEQEEKVLGVTVHPSLLASSMALLPASKRMGDHPFGFSGRATIFFRENTLIRNYVFMDVLSLGVSRTRRLCLQHT